MRYILFFISWLFAFILFGSVADSHESDFNVKTWDTGFENTQIIGGEMGCHFVASAFTSVMPFWSGFLPSVPIRENLKNDFSLCVSNDEISRKKGFYKAINYPDSNISS